MTENSVMIEFLLFQWNRIRFDVSKYSENRFKSPTTQIKGALDKYNIHLFISNSIEDFKLNQYRNFQLILPMRFHFVWYFVNSIIFEWPIGYCIVYLLTSTVKNRKC